MTFFYDSFYLHFLHRNQERGWIGYNDLKQEGKWTWANPQGGCKKFTNWNGGEPNGGRGENCGMMYRDHGGRWNDIPCHLKMAPICEFGSQAVDICPATSPTGKRASIEYTTTL